MCIILENWKAEMEWKLFCCAVLLGEWSCCVVEQPEKNKGEEKREGVCCYHGVGGGVECCCFVLTVVSEAERGKQK